MKLNRVTTILVASLVIVLGAATMTACESKVVEKSPTSEVDVAQLDKQKQQQAASNKDWEAVTASAATQVSDITELLHLASGLLQNKGATLPNVIDVIYSLHKKIRQRSVKINSTEIFLRGTLNINSGDAREECQSLEFLVSSPRTDKIEDLTYFLRSCNTGDTFLPVMIARKVAVGDEGKIESVLELNKENIALLFPIGKALKGLECDFTKDRAGVQQCFNIPIAESENLIWKMDFINIDRETFEFSHDKRWEADLNPILYSGQIEPGDFIVRIIGTAKSDGSQVTKTLAIVDQNFKIKRLESGDVL